jgi:hypothetical protein
LYVTLAGLGVGVAVGLGVAVGAGVFVINGVGPEVPVVTGVTDGVPVVTGVIDGVAVTDGVVVTEGVAVAVGELGPLPPPPQPGISAARGNAAIIVAVQSGNRAIFISQQVESPQIAKSRPNIAVVLPYGVGENKEGRLLSERRPSREGGATPVCGPSLA